MNIDIQNIGRYRLTSHGGRSYDLFNREDDLVYTITADEYGYIMRGVSHHREALCEIIERVQLFKVKVGF